MLFTAPVRYPSGLMTELLVAASLLCWRTESTQADCQAPSSPAAECCEMEPAQPCFIKGMVGSSQHYIYECSEACQKRFEQLSYACYTNFHMSSQWHTMQANCDPKGTVDFAAAAASAAGAATTLVPTAEAKGGAKTAAGDMSSTEEESSHWPTIGTAVAVAISIIGCLVVAFWLYWKTLHSAVQVIDVSVSGRRTSSSSGSNPDIETPPELHAEPQSLRAAAQSMALSAKQQQERDQQALNGNPMTSLPTPARSLRVTASNFN